MKKRKLKRKLKRICLFILILFVILLFVFFKNKDFKNNGDELEVVYLNEIDSSLLNKNVDSDIEKVITDYMNSYYKSISTLESVDITNLYSKDSMEQAYINQTAINLLVESRKLKPYDMKLSEAKYDIIYDKYEFENDLYTIKFYENSYLNFNFMKDTTSKAYGIENEIIIKKIDNEYKIVSYNKVQDFYVMIKNSYDKRTLNNEKYKETLDEIKNEFIKETKDLIDNNQKKFIDYSKNKDKTTLKCDNMYNREKALNYAGEYANRRNTEWTSYDKWGGNCQNYASQVLYAGGIPMDTVGNIALQWKHYSADINTDNLEVGRSYSWTGTTDFYEYAKYNEGYGLCAVTNINPYYALEGDIVQVGYNSSWTHTVVVIGSIKNDKDEMIDLLINSNSIDLVNYPLSAYVYPNVRVIKIIGWNN